MMRVLSIVLLISITVTGAALAQPEGEGVIHPSKEVVHNYEYDEIIPIDKDSVLKDEFSRYIEAVNSGTPNVTSTGILTDEAHKVEIRRLSESEILVLDKSNYKLYRYDKEDDVTTTVASNDPGPGNVAGATGLDVVGSDAFVSANDRRVLRYECNDGCEYKETIRIDFAPFDISVLQDSLYMPGFAFTDQIATDPFTHLIQVVDFGGHRRDEFHNVYQSSNHIIKYYMNKGEVESLGDGELLFSFKLMPYIFEYGYLNLVSVYEISEFKLAERKEGEGLSVNLARYGSEIIEIKQVGQSTAYITVRTYDKGESGGEIEAVDYQYYTIDFAQNTHHFLGRIASSKSYGARIVPTTGKPVLIDAGEVFYFNE